MAKANDKGKKKPGMVAVIVSVSAVLLVAVIVLVAVLGASTPQKVLQSYFEVKYVIGGGSFDQMLQCIAPSLREEFEYLTTMAGLNSSFLANWRTEAMSWVGSDAQIEVEILERTRSDSKSLATAKAAFPGTDEETTVTYLVRMTGSNGQKTLQGNMPFIKIDNRWYMASTYVITGEIEEE